MIDFRTATDRLLSAGVPLSAQAEALDITPSSLSRMRRTPTGADFKNRNVLRPPAGWEGRLARLAADWASLRAQEVVALRALDHEVRSRISDAA
jgi:hypothetical protein